MGHDLESGRPGRGDDRPAGHPSAGPVVPEAGPRRPPAIAEVLGWTVAGAAVILLGFLRGGAGLSNDSFQYLNTAENLVRGRGISTSLVYFDEQRITGRMPAPQTVFPFGYPAAVAALVGLGVPPESAGLLVAACSSTLLVPVFLWAGALLNIRADYLRCGALALILNNAFPTYARAVLSESLFALMALLSLALFLKADAAGRGGAVYRLLGGLMLGLSCWVRYAGLFLVAGALAFHGWRWLRARDREAFLSLLLAGTSVPFVLANLARNLALSGSLRGGNTKPVVRSLTDILKEFSISARYLSLGDGSLREWPCLLATAILLAAIAVAGLAILRRSSIRPAPSSRVGPPPTALAVLYVGFYLLGLAYAGRTSVISLSDPRMLYPLLPVAFLLFGVAATRAGRSASPREGRVIRSSILLALGSYCVLHAYGLASPGRSPRPVAVVRGAVDEPIGDARSLAGWLDAHAPPGQTVIAGDGQAFGYFTRRPTVSLVPAAYSSSAWTEGTLRDTAERYRAGYLVLFAEGSESRAVARESPFVDRLLRGGDLPSWIVPEARNRGVKVFRLEPGRGEGRPVAEPGEAAAAGIIFAGVSYP